jgi:hypothetical protein
VRYEHGYGDALPDVKSYHYHIMEVIYRYDKNNNVKIEGMVEHDALIDSDVNLLLEDIKLVIGAFKKPILDDKGNIIADPILEHKDILVAAGSSAEQLLEKEILGPLIEWYKRAPSSIRKEDILGQNRL